MTSRPGGAVTVTTEVSLPPRWDPVPDIRDRGAPAPGTDHGRRAPDWTRAYALAVGVQVVRRDATTVQVGLEPPRSVLVNDAPPGTVEVLRRLDGHTPLGRIVGGETMGEWNSLFTGLIDIGLVVRAPEGLPLPPHLLEVRTALVHRHGQELADTVVRRRADAMVMVAGSGEVGAAAAELLGASGVGEVHLKAQHRAPPTGRSFVRTGDPAPQLRPALVLLADEHAHNRIMAAGLTVDLTPHLPVSTGIAHAVVGPLVLPGRSACLTCLDRIRRDIDPGWPLVSESSRIDRPRPTPLLTAVAAALSVEQALDHVDGVERPATVDATLEWQSGARAARRRSWYRHPECGCQEIAR